jgi:hypothetical protein
MKNIGAFAALARFPFGWNHPNVKKSRQINNV